MNHPPLDLSYKHLMIIMAVVLILFLFMIFSTPARTGTSSSSQYQKPERNPHINPDHSHQGTW